MALPFAKGGKGGIHTMRNLLKMLALIIVYIIVNDNKD